MIWQYTKILARMLRMIPAHIPNESNKDLWKVTGQEDINVEIRKRKFRWIGHTLRGWRDTKGFPTLEPSGKQKERKTEK